MTNLRDWLSTSFWPDVAAGQPINTKQITKRLETYPAGPVRPRGRGGPTRRLERRNARPVLQDPLLYGENGKPLYGVDPDAVYATVDGYRALLEIEGGGAVQNNRLMKDVVETLLIPGAHHLALAVPHDVHGRSP